MKVLIDDIGKKKVRERNLWSM